MKMLFIISFFSLFLYSNSSFNEVWNIVKKDETTNLPQYKVTFNSLYKDKVDTVTSDALRTLGDSSDILKSFRKKAHPNGICFKGTWNITSQNIYSGYFKKNTKANIIIRASSAMSNTKSGDIRILGLAGKVFPLDKNKKVKSANFFLIDNLGGTKVKYYSDTILVNEPKFSFSSIVLKNLLYSLKLASTFKDVDKNSNIRQLYQVSNLDVNNPSLTITPKWMKLQMQDKYKGIKRENIDFRDELHIRGNKTLVYNIFVSSQKINDIINWEQVGTIVLDKSVVSTSCDTRLHFNHPVWIDDLKYSK